jgi:hypothetical protein
MQYHNQNGELVHFVDAVEPVSTRGDDIAGPLLIDAVEPVAGRGDEIAIFPPPPPEQFCCDINCFTCSSTSCFKKDCHFWVRLHLFKLVL